ncbi:hypothetical protein HK099_002746, partial [Clydaea vesicula]
MLADNKNWFDQFFENLTENILQFDKNNFSIENLFLNQINGDFDKNLMCIARHHLSCSLFQPPSNNDISRLAFFIETISTRSDSYVSLALQVNMYSESLYKNFQTKVSCQKNEFDNFLHQKSVQQKIEFVVEFLLNHVTVFKPSFSVLQGLFNIFQKLSEEWGNNKRQQIEVASKITELANLLSK